MVRRKKLDWVEKNNRDLRKLSGQERESAWHLTVDQRAPPAGTSAHEPGRAETTVHHGDELCCTGQVRKAGPIQHLPHNSSLHQ